MKRDADVSKRLLNDVKLQLKNMKSEQEQAQSKAEEQKKETVEAKSQIDKERRAASKFKDDHDKMKEKFDEYRRGMNSSIFCLYSELISTRSKLKNMPERGRNRTYDLWNASPMLCQLNYAIRSVQVCHTSDRFS